MNFFFFFIGYTITHREREREREVSTTLSKVLSLQLNRRSLKILNVETVENSVNDKMNVAFN